MSVPLRKDEFIANDGIVEDGIVENALTTADLAQGKRPAAKEDRATSGLLKDDPVKDVVKNDLQKNDLQKDARPGPVLADRNGVENAPAVVQNATPLFPNNELDELQNRWSAVQTAFVDEPRKAVEQADSLVASAMKRLAEVFADERATLEKAWDRGDNVSTEDLRIALQRYRSFFQRLLSV
jgi:hypothetical protein